MAKKAKQGVDKPAEIIIDDDCLLEGQPDNSWSDMDAGSKLNAVEKRSETAAPNETDEHQIQVDAKAKIRRLNSRLRKTGEGGMFVLTSGVMALPAKLKAECLELLQRDYSSGEHNPDNDPIDEYDFGTIEHEGALIFWKIDYYDLDMLHHSPDPADDNVTKRILTIMLASEY